MTVVGGAHRWGSHDLFVEGDGGVTGLDVLIEKIWGVRFFLERYKKMMRMRETIEKGVCSARNGGVILLQGFHKCDFVRIVEAKHRRLRGRTSPHSTWEADYRGNKQKSSFEWLCKMQCLVVVDCELDTVLDTVPRIE